MEISRHSHRLPETFTHTHQAEYEIMYCIRGSYLFHYERADHTLVEGIVRSPKTMIIIPKNVAHGLQVLQYPYERYFILFSDRIAEKMLNDSAMRSILSKEAEGDELEPRFLDVSTAVDAIEPLLERMYDIQFSLDMDSDWKEVNLTSLFGLFFCELYRNYRSFFAKSLAQYTPPVKAAKEYMDVHFDQPITINELARECFLSPNYLSKSFRSQIGMSPRQYLTQLRLSMAKKLLCSSQLPIQEIAMRAGFGDVNCFIAQFKGSFGTTPKKYRKTVIEEQVLD